MGKQIVQRPMGDIVFALDFDILRRRYAGSACYYCFELRGSRTRDPENTAKTKQLSADKLVMVSMSFGWPAAIESRSMLVPEVPKIFKNQ
jgi:hypothetical protein